MMGQIPMKTDSIDYVCTITFYLSLYYIVVIVALFCSLVCTSLTFML